MQDPCVGSSTDGFAAVKAKWKQNASKFGSPLPRSVPLKQRMSSEHDSDEAEGEEDPSFSKPVAETVLGGRPEMAETNKSVHDSTCLKSQALDPAKQQPRKVSVLARWDAGRKAQREETAAKSSAIGTTDPFLVDHKKKDEPSQQKKLWQLSSFRQTVDTATKSAKCVVEGGECKDGEPATRPSTSVLSPLMKLRQISSSFRIGSNTTEGASSVASDKGKKQITIPPDAEMKEQDEKGKHAENEGREKKRTNESAASASQEKSSLQVVKEPMDLSAASENLASSRSAFKPTVNRPSDLKMPYGTATTQRSLTHARNPEDKASEICSAPSSPLPSKSKKEEETAPMPPPPTSRLPPKSPGRKKKAAVAFPLQEMIATPSTSTETETPKQPKSQVRKTKVLSVVSPGLPAPTVVSAKNGDIKSSSQSSSTSSNNNNHFGKKHQNGAIPEQCSRRVNQKQQAIREPQRNKEQNFADLPVFSHSDADEDVILQALYNDEVFTNVTTGQMKHLVAAFEKTTCMAGDIIVQEGDTSNDYFYIVDCGIVEITVEEHHITICAKGNSFGEMALLYDCPSGITAMALEDCHLFRIDAISFRTILETECKRSQMKKLRLLQGINFLEYVPAHSVKLLAEAMTPRVFRSGENVLEEGQEASAFYIVSEGRLRAKNGSTKLLKTGDYFGESDLATGLRVKSSIVAVSESMVFSISKHIFEKALGTMSGAILKDKDVRCIWQIPFIKSAVESREQIAVLADSLRDKSFAANEEIMVKREVTKAALYLVRKGSVIIKKTNSSGTLTEVVTSGGHFGETLMQRAHGKSKRFIKSPYSIAASADGVEVAMLSIKDFWSVVDPSRLAIKERSHKEEEFVKEINEDVGKEPRALKQQAIEPLPVPPIIDVKKENLQKHVILGEGTFGQVWLVYDKSTKGEELCTYALKIQSKAFLVEENQVEAVIQEKIMMENLKHPFMIRLFATYQDSKFVYMVLDFAQGGELFSLMHENDSFKMTEDHAKFYALCIADVIAYLHRGKYVYRDLKPENVMIDSLGFVKLIDFGFCKYLLGEKTYTLCGTPGYLAPEVVSVEGHDFSADLWSLGILIYEMITGESPFYYDGIDQVELFESIVHDAFKPPSGVSQEAAHIMCQLLAKDPSRRLGARGEGQIVEHSWFASLDLNAVRRRDPSISVPWIPGVSGSLDTRYFNDWSALEREAQKEASPSGDASKKGQLLSARDAKIFEGVF